MPARRLLEALSFCLAVALALSGFELRADEPAPAAESSSKTKPSTPEDAEYYELFKTLADTIDQVDRNYVKDVSRRELMEAAIRGVLSKLDPYSNYIAPDDAERFKVTVENQFTGIGIKVEQRRGMLTIVTPIVGSPAYKAGVQAGDVITEIEGKSAEGIDLDEAVRRLKGEPGSSVTFKVQHPGGAGIEKMTVARELIQMESVLGDRRNDRDEWDFMLDPAKKIGYIRIVSFGRETQGELKKALDQLKKENVRGLVLDLRFNPGGLLGSAIAVADMFLTEGEIVSTSGRNSPKRTWSAHKPDTYEGFPMVVLVNRASASASEIVSASLQDHKRAIVVGERTWGKGSVQTVVDLEGGKSMLKLTTASYQRPNGHNIHRFPDAKESDEWGVMPDAGYELKLDDHEFLQLQIYRRDRDILMVNHATGQATAANDASKAPPPATTTPKAPVASAGFVDRQLQKAVDYLSSELAKAP